MTMPLLCVCTLLQVADLSQQNDSLKADAEQLREQLSGAEAAADEAARKSREAEQKLADGAESEGLQRELQALREAQAAKVGVLRVSMPFFVAHQEQPNKACTAFKLVN